MQCYLNSETYNVDEVDIFCNITPDEDIKSNNEKYVGRKVIKRSFII